MIFIVAVNFVATMELAANPINVAIADAIAATPLLFFGRRGQIVAAIYGVMIPIYPALSASGFAGVTIYAIVDVLAILQIAVAGRWDVGSGRAVRIVYRGFVDFRRASSPRPELADRLGIHQTQGRKS